MEFHIDESPFPPFHLFYPPNPDLKCITLLTPHPTRVGFLTQHNLPFCRETRLSPTSQLPISIGSSRYCSMPHGSPSSSTKRTLDAWSLTCDRRCSSSMTPYWCFQQTQAALRLPQATHTLLFILVEVRNVTSLHWIGREETAVVSVVNRCLECHQLSTSTVVSILHITQPTITYSYYPAQPPLQQLKHHKHHKCCHNTPRNTLPYSLSQKEWEHSWSRYRKRSFQCAALNTAASSRSHSKARK